MPPLPSKAISNRDARNLDIGNEVIAHVQRLLPYGSGNQRPDYDRTAGESATRTQVAYETHTREGAGVFKPRLLAGISSQVGAGNCDSTGAMAYCLLRGTLTNDYTVSFIQVKGHTYAAFRHYMQDASEAVIVDPWPPQGMAVLAKDHFCFNWKEVWRTDKPGKKDPLIESKPADRLTLRQEKYLFLDLLIKQDIDNLPAAPAFEGYTHLLCSNTVSMYIDENNIPVAPPLSRALMQMPPMPAALPAALPAAQPAVQPAALPAPGVAGP